MAQLPAQEEILPVLSPELRPRAHHALPFSRVLVLAPHTDDAELGCGGSIARLVESGAEVQVVAFSGCDVSLPPGSAPDRLRLEFARSTASLGIPESRAFVLRYPVREFSAHRQRILEELVRLRRDFSPQAVFLPSATDLHQDHQVIRNEGVRAFKEITVWGYELPWNQITSSAQAFIALEPHHLDAKWQALRCYQTQLDLARSYFSWDFISGLARVRGAQIRKPLAEAFEVVRFTC